MSNNPFNASANPFIPAPLPGQTPPMPGQTAPAADMFEVDLTEVSSGLIIPDGDYPVRCIDVEQGVSQAGNPQYIWTFTITTGANSGMDFKVFTALTPAAMWKVAEVVTALGVGATGQVVKFRKSDVINKNCVATIEKSTYKGQERSSIVRVTAG